MDPQTILILVLVVLVLALGGFIAGVIVGAKLTRNRW